MNTDSLHEGEDILKGKKILLVEDDPYLGKILTEKIQMTGADITHIERGDVAWDEVQKNIPEAMLLDIRLPGMDGFQILEGMRADNKMKNVPVIIISNFDQVKDKERGARLNAEYLVKALVDPKDIVAALRKLFVK
jgi:DNA-binding response OmpR family regulator